jgi:hypothetical protein
MPNTGMHDDVIISYDIKAQSDFYLLQKHIFYIKIWCINKM